MTDADPNRSSWRDPAGLRTAAHLVIVAAGSWWLLGQLAVVLRPLLVAVFLSYVLLPYYAQLRRNRVPTAPALGLLAGATALMLVAAGAVVYGSLRELGDDLPQLKRRAVDLLSQLTGYVKANLPMVGPAAFGPAPEESVAQAVTDVARLAVNGAGGVLVEAAAAGLYLVFLLPAAERLPAKVRAAYPPQEAEPILDAAGRINAAIVRYLRAKVKSSLLLADPAGLVLAACGVPFAGLWAALTFLCNFIPYVGSVVGYSVPVGFAVLAVGPGPAITAAGVLLALHVGTATLVEPTLLGRAVGLSPLVILAALAVWGQVWGLPGMFLAVPLTVVLKIVFENLPITRPVAKLIEE